MTRPAILSTLLLIAATVHPLPKTPQRVSYEAPPQMMVNIMALLDACREFDVDPDFAFSVAWQESRLKEYAKGRHRNEAGTWGPVLARGLMQISVQYQDELVRKYLPWMNPRNFQWWNPVHSADLGCAMLADYVGRYGKWGSLACYNAGEGRYKQLMKYGRRLPQETIDYQRKVLG